MRQENTFEYERTNEDDTASCQLSTVIEIKLCLESIYVVVLEVFCRYQQTKVKCFIGSLSGFILCPSQAVLDNDYVTIEEDFHCQI